MTVPIEIAKGIGSGSMTILVCRPQRSNIVLTMSL